MISYSRLPHFVILAQPKPKPIELPSYSDRSNCRKAMLREAKRDGLDRSAFQIVETTMGRFRYEKVSPEQHSSGS